MHSVLIVDDERDLASLLEFNLQQAGLKTRVALTGEEALALARAQPPDVVLLDLMLPDLSGKEVCRRLRSEPATRDVPIIMLTARGEEADRVSGFEVGADDYVTKPFSPRELVLRVKAILRRAAPPADGVRLSVGLLSLDTGTHHAWVDSQPLESHRPGIQAAAALHEQPRPGAVAGTAALGGVGRQLLARDAHGGHPRDAAAREAGPRAREHRDRARRGLPALSAELRG